MKRVIAVPAVLAGAALGELKQWLAIRGDAEDASLTALLRSSLETCEGFVGAMPLAATCEEVLSASREWQRLATRPVHAIESVEAIPAEGVRYALAPDAYEIELDADGGGRVRLIRQGNAGRVAVRFTAGLAYGWDTLPDGMRHGIVRLSAHLYRQRDGEAATAPPAAVAALWRPWRRLRVA